MRCSYCGKSVDGLPHKCKFCGRVHCYKHLQPENHNCKRLRRPSGWNIPKREVPEPPREPAPQSTNTPKLILFEKIKRYLLDKYENLLNWLKGREYYSYNFKGRFSYLLTTILTFVVAVVSFSIFYSNAQKLNDVNLWIIKLGGVLILISLFFAIKFGWRLGKEGINILKRQRNWLKYLIIILIIFLLWQAYKNKDTVLNPVFDTYNKTNFSLFAPISFGNFSFESDSSPLTRNKQSPIFSDSEKRLSGSDSNEDVAIIEQEILALVNEERLGYGAEELIAKSNLNSFARSWSDKMISQNFFEHSNLNFVYPSIAGENIGETPIHYSVLGCGSTYTNNQMAKCFVDGWISSPGHHENMINKRFSMTGIGVSCDLSKCRATQVFSG